MVIEIALAVISGLQLLYYGFLRLIQEGSWQTHSYWVISAAVYLLLAGCLYLDRRRRKEHRRCLSLELRTIMITSLILYFTILGIFVCLLFTCSFQDTEEELDYLILIENGDLEEKLTASDYRALNLAVRYLEEHENTKLMLAGCSRQDVDIDEKSIQILMQHYLKKQNVKDDRIIVERISSNFRQNIVYSYAYILVDWYGSEFARSDEPKVGIVSDSTSGFRYQLVGKHLKRNLHIVRFYEPFYLWPARIMEELELVIRYHLQNQFISVEKTTVSIGGE